MNTLNELFKNPPAEYRAVPFWAWNCKLDRERLQEQIEVFQKMGFGGFHIHSRIGLDTPYLSDEFMEWLLFAMNAAKSMGCLRGCMTRISGLPVLAAVS